MASNTAAYGFINLQHLFNQRVADAGPAIVYDAVRLTAAEHTREINELMSAFVMTTEVAQEQYALPGGGTLQPLDEIGNPKTTRAGETWQVGFPIKGAGDAYGMDRVTAAMMTVEEVNNIVTNMQMKDASWNRLHLLKSILDNVSWTYNDIVGRGGYRGLGNITVRPLANADNVVYPFAGISDPATDNHYYAQAAAIADNANPYPTILTELSEHPTNSGPYVAYIATSLVATTQALATFIAVRDADVQPGSGSDTLVGTLSEGFGDSVLGKVGDMWIVEWRGLPAGYGIAHARGAGQFVKMREYPAPELKGFFTEQFDVDGNHKGTRMLRYAGYGVANRIAAAAFQIGNATYQVPSGYTASEDI